MADERVKRRLAAIFVADVVGYTRHMERDEAGTLSRLKARRRDVLDPLLLRHEGRLVKILGDGILAEFASAASAVRCAVELQRDMAAANEGLPETRQYVLRIGISLGDVIVEGKDLYGNGVNLAVRLESHGNAGDITISSNVFDQVCREVVAEYDDLGPVSMKNFAKSVHAYRVRPCPQQPPEADGGQSTPLSLPPRPSIAVLPFNTMGANAEHGAFADGLTEDLITELSRTPGLFVIAQHSAFAYKGKPVDVRQIATELGVRYLLEGSARRSAERVRVNVQLVDTLGGGYLWAERYDREIEDIFAVQDDVAARIVEALVGRLIVLPMRNRPKSMEAYDLCVRARSLGWNSAGSPEAIYESIVLLQQAIAIDPSYAEAHGWLAFNLWSTWANAMDATGDNRRLSLEMAKKAVALDANDAQSRWILGYLLAYEGRWSESDAAFDAAIAMDRNSADALIFRAELLAFAGRASEAMDVMEQAFRLNPHPTASYYWEQSLVYYVAGQYEKAIETVRGGPAYRTGARRILAASLAQAGNLNEARQEAALFMANNPNFSIGKWAASQPFRDPETRQLFVEGYSKAGLPE
ncbi:adenylate/guanylate cyclase domain-containing protein [Phyllobacterium sp. SYP-B3895]|uniref:adenylate/guanylate cyclase domain-containing protein n=1 Tax=Phyllobacterium sp. SYP-B3895 TaxID=2663240 RepID=UPI00129983F7|nr:adenylate/guanylate cyclase domain-containing protein [Phyllobacterium sp. SYP-B3895]MRG57347.1 adenylate/guanylate cyclase domain-containing protein [Phyllobacterium sp. SYP-B3895]